jgi:hypothetical protein
LKKAFSKHETCEILNLHILVCLTLAAINFVLLKYLYRISWKSCKQCRNNKTKINPGTAPVNETQKSLNWVHVNSSCCGRKAVSSLAAAHIEYVALKNICVSAWRTWDQKTESKNWLSSHRVMANAQFFSKLYTIAYILKRRTADDGLVLRDQQGYRLCDVTDPSGGFVTSGARHSANNSSTWYSSSSRRGESSL